MGTMTVFVYRTANPKSARKYSTIPNTDLEEGFEIASNCVNSLKLKIYACSGQRGVNNVLANQRPWWPCLLMNWLHKCKPDCGYSVRTNVLLGLCQMRVPSSDQYVCVSVRQCGKIKH